MSNIPIYHVYEAANSIIEINSFFIKPTPSNCLEVRINENYEYVNNIPLNQGNLFSISKKNSIDTLFEVDNNGNLLLFLSNDNSLTQEYEIDNQGHLILTHTI